MILNFDAECQRTNQVQEENEVLRQKVCSERAGSLSGKHVCFGVAVGTVNYRKGELFSDESESLGVGIWGRTSSDNQS